MKTPLPFSVPFLLLALSAGGQGTFIYDQQATNTIEGSAPWTDNFQPLGQSFTPTFSSVDFVELGLFYSDAFNHAGATVSLNFRANSITGTILRSSLPVFIPGNFAGVTNFLFAIPVTVVPGTMYFLQPTIQSGGSVSSDVTDGSYAGGTAFGQGIAAPNLDLWFREGIVVPEPSAWALILLGCVAALRWKLSFQRRP